MGEEKDEVKFNEQAFLLDFFQETVYQNTDGTTPHSYNNFVQIIGDSSALMNRLLVKGNANILWKLTNPQLAMLVPKVAIYKVLKGPNGKVIEDRFRFNEYTTVDSITLSSRGRGSDAGLVSFVWNDLGTNPGDTGLSFEATLKLKFQSFDGIFKVRNEATGLKFADLLVPPGATRGKGDAKIVGAKREVDVSDFQVKVKVGWETPIDPGRVIFKDPKTITAITDAQISLLLTLTTHDIDIKEDGSIDLTINYMAALEGRMMSPKSDLLKREDEKFDVQMKKDIEEKQKLSKSVAVSKAGVKKTKKRATGREDDFEDQLEGEEKELEKRSTRLAELKKTIAKGKKDHKQEAYSRLLAQIESKSRRVFFFSLNQDQIETYAEMNSENFDELKKEPVKRREEIARWRRTMKASIKSLAGDKGFKASQEGEVNPTLINLNKELAAAGGDSAKDRKEARDKVLKDYQEKAKDKEEELQEAPDLKVSFFYFGDLVEAALAILKDNPATKAVEVNFPVEFSFMLGMINLYDPDADKLVSVPLSDIPISLKVFTSWFVKNIVEKNSSSLPLISFLRRVCTQMITGALSPYHFGTTKKSASQTKISTSSLFLHEKSIGQTSGRLSTSAINGNTSAQAAAASLSKERQFYFMYVGGNLNQRLKGDRASDEALGIFHLRIGAQQGLLKKITFKRTDVPFQRESRILDAKSGASSNLLFSDVYNSDITMVGNPIFKPGMLMFIDPTALGLGRPATKAKDVTSSFASQIGLGGYYLVTKVENTIESGKFDTSISLMAQTPMSAIEPVQLSTKVPVNSVDKTPAKVKKPITDKPEKKRELTGKQKTQAKAEMAATKKELEQF